MIAIVRIRGRTGLKPKIATTLRTLGLKRTNQCVIFPESPSLEGMLRICKDYVGWGEADEKTLSALANRAGIKLEDVKGRVFSLHPPRKGYRKIKKSFPYGACGKQEINELLRRMI